MGDVYNVSSGTQALVASTTKTILQIASPATSRVKLNFLSVSFDGAASATPVKVTLLRQTSAGTGSSAATPAPLDIDGIAATSTCIKGCATEPASGTELYSWYVTPNGSGFALSFPPGEEPLIDDSGGTQPRLGLSINAPAAVNAIANFTFTE